MTLPTASPPPLRSAIRPVAFGLCSAVLLALAGALPVQAQVLRCTDAATGKVTYTNGSCAQGATTREVEARKTPEQIQEEREQAAEALARKRERDQQEATHQREQQAAERAAAPRRTAPAPAPGNDPAQSAECQQARRALQEVNASLGRGMYDEQARLDQAHRQADLACLSPAAYAEAERSRAQRTAVYPPAYYTPPVVVTPRPPRPQPAPAITNCNVFRCYDSQGNTYPRR